MSKFYPSCFLNFSFGLRVLPVFLLFCLVLNTNVYADFVNLSGVIGDFEDVGTWDAGNQPNTNGNLSERMYVNGEVTRFGDLNPVDVFVTGKLSVSGFYENDDAWGGLVIQDGGMVEIFGDFYGSSGVEVKEGGTLVVHGDFSSTGSSVKINGNLIVLGSYSSSSNSVVTLTGNLVVGGDLTHSNGGFNTPSGNANIYVLDPNANINTPGWGQINNGDYGDLDDFIQNEADNDDLMDIVEDLDILPSTTWYAMASGSWDDPSIWTFDASGVLFENPQNIAPSVETKDVVILSGSNVVVDNGNFIQISGLTLDLGATLTLKPGAHITVNGSLVTNDGLSIENSLIAPSSIVTNGSVVGNTEIKWTFPENRYMYIGHSVEGVEYFDYDAPTGSTFSLYRYSRGWLEIPSSYSFLNNALGNFAFRFDGVGDVDVSHSGVLHNDDYSLSINGWHLIANPYQAYIDVEDSGFDNGNSLPTIWTSTMATGELVFTTYNTYLGVGANGGSRFIPPGQSFWLRNYSPSTFNIKPSVRTHGRGELKSARKSSGNVLRFELFDGAVSDEVVLVFGEQGAENTTPFDSEKRLGQGEVVPNLYVLKGDEKFAIGLFPDGFVVDSIKVGYKFVEKKEITFKVSNIQSFDFSEEVYLFDKLTKIKTDLRKVSEYRFMSQGGEYNNRFVVLFKQGRNGISTLVDDRWGDEQTGASVFCSDGKINVAISQELLTHGSAQIKVVGLGGQELLDMTTLSGKNQLSLGNISGICLVKVTVGRYVFTEKVIMK